jgi:uncharacterized protein YbbC (DUF1343 family)
MLLKSRRWGLVLTGIFFCASLTEAAPKKNVLTGLDVLAQHQFASLRGKRVGLICNHTALSQKGEHLVDLLQASGVCQIKAIFAPEHGYRGDHADGSTIQDSIDPATQARIFSLYGKVNRPTKEMLAGIDLLIYDIQDVGVRFYTYITTLTYVMESAAEAGIPLMILDRPNPIRGDRIEGPMLDLRFKSFVGAHALPIRYGLTVGELALLINSENWLANGLKADLQIVKMEGWQRSLWYDETNLPWVAPSPNMKTVETAIVYPGFCLIEGTNLSEGRGTESPFLQFGAPWIMAQSYAQALQNLQLPGVSFEPVQFIPKAIPGVASNPKYTGELCQGVRLVVTDRNQFKPIEAIIKVLLVTRQLYPSQFQFREASFTRLYGSDQWQAQFDAELINSWEQSLLEFQKLSERYYLYH